VAIVAASRNINKHCCVQHEFHVNVVVFQTPFKTNCAFVSIFDSCTCE